jgi:hypothetical protein
MPSFLDEMDLLLAEMWNGQLRPSMLTSRYFLVFASQVYVDKVNAGNNFCFLEYNEAKRLGLIMVLVVFDDVELTDALDESHFDYKMRCTSSETSVPNVTEFLSNIVSDDPNPRPMENSSQLQCILHEYPKCEIDFRNGKVNCGSCGGSLDQYVVVTVSCGGNNVPLRIGSWITGCKPKIIKNLRVLNCLLRMTAVAIEGQWINAIDNNDRTKLFLDTFPVIYRNFVDHVRKKLFHSFIYFDLPFTFCSPTRNGISASHGIGLTANTILISIKFSTKWANTLECPRSVQIFP